MSPSNNRNRGYFTLSLHRSPLAKLILNIILFSVCSALGSVYGAAQSLTQQRVDIEVRDDQGELIPGASVQISIDGRTSATFSDNNGHLSFQRLPSQVCEIVVTITGYQIAHVELKADEILNLPLQIQLEKTLQTSEVVTVTADASHPIATTQSSEIRLDTSQAVADPSKPATLADALPLVPGVIRTPDGRTRIAGADEQHSALIVNSIDVTDPATGSFGSSVPIDSVNAVKIMQSPYLAQYGNFTAGVVSAETRRGNDKWDYSLNDPLPEIRIRSGHLMGIRAATPRLNFSGPLVKDKLYILEGAEYLLHKNQVRTLPFAGSETQSKTINSFTQIDATLTSKQTLTATLHVAPRTIRFAGLNFFDPQGVTPNTHNSEQTGTITHRLAIGEGLLSSGIAITHTTSEFEPQATSGEMVLSPVGNSGNYFAHSNTEAQRTQWLETWSPPVFRWHGSHSIQAGTLLAYATTDGITQANNARITDASGNLLRLITYTTGRRYTVDDVEVSTYTQDHWVVSPSFAIDAGIRWEKQSVTSAIRVAPRGGFTWAPTADHGNTVIRAGLGVFYDQVPLDTYAFTRFPKQTVTTYDSSGNVTDGPRLFDNLTTTEPESSFALLDRKRRSGNFAPYSLAWNMELEHRFRRWISVRTRYLESRNRNQLTLQSEITATQSALVLGGSGEAQVRQFDIVTAIGSSSDQKLNISYVHQYARGVLTDVSSYLGSTRFPVARSLSEASAPGEIPNRFLAWGTWALPWRMRISPHFEFRTGFPYQPTDRLQQYVPFDTYTQPRYPSYFSADARLSKDLNVSAKHAVRLSLNGTNLTNHSNYLQVHNNTADPQFGGFFGNYDRRFQIDFDFLF